MIHSVKLMSIICMMVVIGACSSIDTNSPEHLIGYTEHGKASFYAAKYQFRTTASGDRFNQFAKTAAHKTLPFGAKVKVTNLANNAVVVVKINDRGPFIKGRIIDLSRSAFAAIADTDVGVVRVKIEVIR